MAYSRGFWVWVVWIQANSSFTDCCCFLLLLLLGGALVTDGGPARLFSPLVPKPPGAPAAATLPLMFYMPGVFLRVPLCL
jgi:hypothetical protein